jgi:hypothetical protein
MKMPVKTAFQKKDVRRRVTSLGRFNIYEEVKNA